MEKRHADKAAAATRRYFSPPAGVMRGTFLTLVFLVFAFASAFSPPLAALDEARIAEIVRLIKEGPRAAAARVSDDMRAAWYALGLMARPDYAEILATGEELEAFVRARRVYKDARREHLEKGQPYWLAYNTSQGEERERAKREYEIHGLPLEEKRNAASMALDEVRASLEEGVARHYRLLFFRAIDRQAELLHITHGAATLLKLAYFHLELHFGRDIATQPQIDPRLESARNALLAGIRARADAEPREPTARDAVIQEIRGCLMEFYLLAEGESYTATPRASKTQVTVEISLFDDIVNDWGGITGELSDEAREVQLRKYCLEAATVLVELAEEMDADWGVRH